MINLAEIIRQLSANAKVIHSLALAFPEAHTRWTPNPQTWAMKDVMEHVYNEERGDFRKRLKVMWGQASTEEYRKTESCRQALEGFLEEREVSLAWLRSLDAPDWDASLLMHFGPEQTPFTLSAGEALVSWVDHDFLHMRQMVELLHAWNEQQASPYSVRYAGEW